MSRRMLCFRILEVCANYPQCKTHQEAVACRLLLPPLVLVLFASWIFRIHPHEQIVPLPQPCFFCGLNPNPCHGELPLLGGLDPNFGCEPPISDEITAGPLSVRCFLCQAQCLHQCQPLTLGWRPRSWSLREGDAIPLERWMFTAGTPSQSIKRMDFVTGARVCSLQMRGTQIHTVDKDGVLRNQI